MIPIATRRGIVDVGELAADLRGHGPVFRVVAGDSVGVAALVVQVPRHWQGSGDRAVLLGVMVPACYELTARGHAERRRAELQGDAYPYDLEPGA
jgi:hypothetical protein